jgi:Mrp family chromosome partitioning ATPase
VRRGKTRRARERTHDDVDPDVAAGVAPDGGLAIVDEFGNAIHTAPVSVTSSLRYMLTRLQLNDPIGLPRRLAFTSALRREGVTFVSRSVAAVMAQDLDRRVCHVSLNWWSSSDDATVPGLSDVVRRQATLADVIRPTASPNLSYVLSGRLPLAQRSALAQDLALGATLDDLTVRFDHLVLDVPAVLTTSDGPALARLGDAYALVVYQGVTTTSQVGEALHELSSVPTVGVVLNRYRTSIPRSIQRLVGV